MRPKWTWIDATVSIVVLAYALLTIIMVFSP